jgi:hypothetical protein
MRQVTDAAAVRAVLERLGRATTARVRIYLTGGATAVLRGWRATTIDIDLKLVPDDDRVLRAMQSLKDDLQVNLELAAPDQFIPPLPGWEGRSLFIAQVGSVAFYHYDPYAQTWRRSSVDTSITLRTPSRWSVMAWSTPMSWCDSTKRSSPSSTATRQSTRRRSAQRWSRSPVRSLEFGEGLPERDLRPLRGLLAAP